MAKTYPVRPFLIGRYDETQKYESTRRASAQTFAHGAVVVRSSGAIAEATSPFDPNPSGGRQYVAGVAQHAAAGTNWQADTLGHEVPRVTVAKPTAEFVGTFGSATATGSPVTAADPGALVGASYGLVKDAGTGFWVIDSAETTATAVAVVVTGIQAGVEAGDANIPVRFRFLDQAVEAVVL